MMMARWWVWARLWGLASTCGACVNVQPFLCDPGRRVATVVVHEVYPHEDELDLLLVVDNSASMVEEQAAVIAGVSELIRTFASSLSPRHVGIVTTDVSAPADGGRLRPWPGGAAYATWPPPPGIGVDAAVEMLVAGATLVIQTAGRAGSEREAGLEAMRSALVPPDASVAARNAGFLSPGANLVVLVFSDEDDCSATSYAGDDGSDVWCLRGAETIDIQAYVELLAGLEGEGRRVGFGVVAGGVRPSPPAELVDPVGCLAGPEGAVSACGCWTNATPGDPAACAYLTEHGQVCAEPSTCPATCAALPGDRYGALVRAWREHLQAAGQPRPWGAMESICDPPEDWFVSRSIPVVPTLPEHCVRLAQRIASPGAMEVQVRARDPVTGVEYEAVLPRLDSNGGPGSCDTCEACPQGAWALLNEYADGPEVCLVCGPRSGFLLEMKVTAVIVEDLVDGRGC